ncbi:MAG: hypothetical protein WDA53_00585 [Bacillota bacterium]
MSQLTNIECIMLENHYKSDLALVQLMEFARQNCIEPSCKNICETMVKDHQQQAAGLARFI